ncbi:MAG: type V CRISPR-associated protein Cas4 [Bacteroidia bacterium]|jgi:CRISPR-associated protein Cas4
METYLPISYLNDFVFCPYSIYLHQVFDNNTEELYSANPQQTGKSAHSNIDSQETNRPKVLNGIYVLSSKFGVYGKIDKFYINEGKLVESKYEIKTLYRGYYYQIWAQYFALTEMGYQVNSIRFYSIKNNTTYKLNLPNEADALELKNHIRKIAWFDFSQEITTNPEKCKHCIYAALCDKTQLEHVYA